MRMYVSENKVNSEAMCLTIMRLLGSRLWVTEQLCSFLSRLSFFNPSASGLWAELTPSPVVGITQRGSKHANTLGA